MICLDKPLTPYSLPFLLMGKTPLFLLWSFTVSARFPSWTLDFQSCVPLPVFPGFQLQCLFSRHLAFQSCQLVSNKSVAYICLYNITCWHCLKKKKQKQPVLFSVPEHEPGATPFGSFVHNVMGSLLLYYHIMWSANQRILLLCW